MDQWEYTTLNFKIGGFLSAKIDQEKFEAELNRYGSQGWEMVSCFDMNDAQGQSKNVMVLFKRKR